jgi:cytochrome P450
MKKPVSDFAVNYPEDFDATYSEYAALREQCPVAWTNSLGGFWAISRYEDVKRAASESSTFITSKQNVVPKVAFTGRRPPLHLDPPEHTPYRKALNPLLSKECSEGFADRTRELASALLAPMVQRGGGDICTEFSSYLPVQVFGEWMRMPKDWLPTLHERGRSFVLSVHQNNPDGMKDTSLKLYELARAMIALRKENPQDPAVDPTSALLAARLDGQPLPEDLLVGTVRQVLLVGIVAPMVMIGTMCVHLGRDTNLQAQLRRDPALLSAAIEEFLRLYTPYRGFARTAVRDVEMSGRTIPAEEPIALLYCSANRDESVFPRGDEFILDRPNIAEHLAFGRGPHNCPGIHLGRMQLRVAMEEILASTPGGFELDGEITLSRWPEIGALSVPLRFLPAG